MTGEVPGPSRESPSRESPSREGPGAATKAARAERVDLVIVGAGLAGASLAWRLADEAFAGMRIVVLEPRERFADDRTWCSWRVAPHPFEGDIVASWRRLEVRRPGGRVEVTPGAAYDCLPAGRFYRRVLPRLEAAGHLSLRLGTRVHAVDAESPTTVTVEHGGGTLVADAVFDSRPPGPPTGGLVQHFLGWWVEAEGDVFDPACATLMDFDVPQDGAIHFVYALPLGRRRALVESTWIGPPPEPPPDYASHLRRWLARRLGATPWRVVDREEGRLPMTPDLAPRRRAPATRHVAIGARGGALRPSSGYAFQRVQAACDDLAAQLGGGSWRCHGLRPPSYDRRPEAAMDRLFLSLLARRPELAAEIFYRLFERCPSDRLVRFLAGTGGWRDRAAVMRSLPAAPFLGAAVREVLGGR